MGCKARVPRRHVIVINKVTALTEFKPEAHCNTQLSVAIHHNEDLSAAVGNAAVGHRTSAGGAAIPNDWDEGQCRSLPRPPMMD